MWYSFEPYPLRHFSWVFFLPDVHRISPLGPCCGGEISAPWLWVLSGCQRLPRSCWGTLHWRRWGQQLWIQLRPWLETNVWRWKMREKIWKHEWLIYVDMVGSFNLFFNLFSLISVGWGSPMMFGALEQWWYQVLWVSEDPYWWRGDPQLLCFDLPSTSEEHLTHGAPTSSQWCLGHCSNHLDISMPCARWWLDQKRVAPISRYFMYIFAFFAYFPIYLSLYFICSFFLYFS